MGGRRTRSDRRGRALLRALLVTAFGGLCFAAGRCTAPRGRSGDALASDPAARALDSTRAIARHAVDAADSAANTPADTAADTTAGSLEAPAVPADTLAALPAIPPAALPPAPLAARDTAPVAATDADLRALAPTLIVPVQGVAASALRDSYAEARAGHTHEALDILAPRGTPVLSAADGRVTKLHDSRAGGLMVYAADPTDRFLFMYGHLDRYAPGLAAGAPLRRGQVIGYVGTTGDASATTPHLHFVIARGRPSAAWWKGTPVNPYPLLTGK